MRPLVLRGGAVRFDPPFVLAPMEGVTHRAFRDAIMDLGGVGAAWTEFVRVSSHALKPKALARELGAPRADAPVGVQLMAVDPALLAETARNAEIAGAPMIDLNFGCPAPVVFNKCAGSALLRDPERVGALVAAAVGAVRVPVTAKIRVGVTDASRLRDVVQAVDGAGAAGLVVHARTRADGYARPADWRHLEAARGWTRLPLIGNGDVLTPDDALRMTAETGVDGVMIGRGALRDPWVFARLAARRAGRPEPAVGPLEARAFHVAYRDAMFAYVGECGVLGNLKQLYKRLEVGFPLDDARRRAVLRAPDLRALEAALLDAA
ncbi:MAG TPA: tRNA-dihydrouridine synthase family protein [Planctomycetota bacterium]|nr:tRNA-dihydrouridine synthase family protein [Planctomycetota bacterium]